MAISFDSITEIFKRPKAQPAVGGPKTDNSRNSGNPQDFLSRTVDDSGSYKIQSENWYSARPYGFKANLRDGKSVIMFLPISPSNLTISTEFATNMIPTLYGTVEEHSDVRYFDISIEGTTGMAPRFVDPYIGSENTNPSDAYPNVLKSGRTSFAVAQGLSLGGFFPKTLSVINQLKNKAADLLDGGVKAQTGITNANSGYVAFHNLYRFLLQYKKDASGVLNTTVRKTHPLTFFNYKDNNQYDVVVKSFAMRRSADNPMLYFYSIQLRGYNLRTIKNPITDDIKQRLSNLGLSGVDSSSALGDIKTLSRNAKAVIGSFAGGINILGR